jgi:hypothetical protein
MDTQTTKNKVRILSTVALTTGSENSTGEISFSVTTSLLDYFLQAVRNTTDLDIELLQAAKSEFFDSVSGEKMTRFHLHCSGEKARQFSELIRYIYVKLLDKNPVYAN